MTSRTQNLTATSPLQPNSMTSSNKDLSTPTKNTPSRRMTSEEQQVLSYRLNIGEKLYRESIHLALPTSIAVSLLGLSFGVMGWMIDSLFVLLCAFSAVLLGCWTIFQPLRLMKRRNHLRRDLQLGEVTFLEGPIELHETHVRHRGREISHTLTVAGRTFNVRPDDHIRVAQGDLVCLHLATHSTSLLRVDRIPPA